MVKVSWQMARDLMVACALLAGYAWLAVLSTQVRALRRRLAAHVCGEPGRRVRDRDRVHAADLVRRERIRQAREAAERTQPMPVVDEQQWED